MPLAFAGSATYDKNTNTITTYSQCGCGLQGDYKYHTATFLNYCPHCHRYGTLHYTHAEGIPEGRITCGDGYGNGGCDSDYCAVCGKEEVYHGAMWLTKGNPAPVNQTIETSPYKAPTKMDYLKLKLKQPFGAI